jgi:methanol metabolism-related c-type cytochrome
MLIVPLYAFAAAAGDIAEGGGPTYRVAADGTVDWATFNGFRRYGASCLHCHGADGLGSTFAPPMTEAMKTLSYQDFTRIVDGGKITAGSTGQSVMPPFAGDPNVACYLDDIYVYLRARTDGAVPRGRPPKREPQPDAAQRAEATCLRRFGVLGR